MAKYKQFTLNLTKNQIVVIRRLLSGERLTRYRVRFSMCTSIRASHGTYKYANGDKAPRSSVESLKDKGIVKELRVDETLILGYHDYTYAYVISEEIIKGIMASFTPKGNSILTFIY